MTWRRLYVPQLGHAVCGSLGSRHRSQRTSVGAMAFHCARRDRVLLRDILRLGTATAKSPHLFCLGVQLCVSSLLSRPCKAAHLGSATA